MIAGIKMGLMVWAVAGPLLFAAVTWTSMSAREVIVSAAKVQAAKDQGRIECNRRVDELARAHDQAIDAAVDEAVAAADAVAPDSELAALCGRSASCRDRGGK